MKDPAFQSQQFAEQVAQRKQRSLEIQGNAGFQAGEMFLRSMQTASTVASQQVERQQAMEELAWARELHNTDMLELQKKGLAAQVDASRAQADLAIAKAKAEAEGFQPYPERVDAEGIAALLAQGIDTTWHGNKPVVGPATDERRAEGKRMLEDILNRRYEYAAQNSQMRADATIEAARIQAEARGRGGRDYSVSEAADIATSLLKSATAEYSAARDHGTEKEKKDAMEKIRRYQGELDSIQSKTMQKAGIEREEPAVTTREQARNKMTRDILNAVNQHLGVTK